MSIFENILSIFGRKVEDAAKETVSEVAGVDVSEFKGEVKTLVKALKGEGDDVKTLYLLQALVSSGTISNNPKTRALYVILSDTLEELIALEAEDKD